MFLAICGKQCALGAAEELNSLIDPSCGHLRNPSTGCSANQLHSSHRQGPILTALALIKLGNNRTWLTATSLHASPSLGQRTPSTPVCVTL